MNDSHNLMYCSQKKHQAWHVLFSNWEVPRIVEEVNRWINPEWVVTALKLKGGVC